MNDSQPAPRRKLGVGYTFVIFIALLVALPLVVITLWSIGATRRANAELEKVRATGQPMTPADMEAYYALPAPEDDVTPLYLRALAPLDGVGYGQAAAALPIVGTNEAAIPPVGQEWTQLAEAEKLLADYGESMALLHEAARRGGQARYPTRFADGFAMLLPHAQQVRAGARMLQLESWVKAHRGDAHGAALSIDAMFKLAGSMKNEPILVSQLVCIACNSMARKQIENLLPQVSFADEDLVMFQNDLRAIDARDSLRRALIGERALGSQAFLNPDMIADTGTNTGVSPLVYVTRGDDLACYLQYMDRMIATAEQSWAEGRQSRADIDAQFKQQVTASPLARIRYPLTALIMPALGSATDAGARGSAQTLSADAALAAELFRRRNDTWPTAVEQLSPDFLPAVPIDPYNGLPLRIVIRDDTAIVYSVGTDGRDDGGQGDDSGKPDVIFTLRKPR
jgi:hypothetical protein